MATVRYLVTDVDRSVTFYVDRLGFEKVEQMGAAFARVRLGDLTLWLAGPRVRRPRPMPDGEQPAPGGWNRFVLEVDDLADRVSTLTADGVIVPQRDREGAGRQAIPPRRS